MIARLERRTNGIYYIVIDDRMAGGGKKYQSTKTKDKKEAKKILVEIQHKINNNQYGITGKTLFNDFLNEWMNNYVEKNCRRSTFEAYHLCIERHIKPHFKNVILEKLTPSMIHKYYVQKMDDGLSANTVRKHHANICKCLDYAFKLGIIQENPSKRVELPKKVKFKSSFYSKEETINLLAAFKDTTIETPVALAVSLGLRRGEVLGLRWSDVDFEKRQINICNTRVKVVSEIVDVTKTDSSTRVLDLPDFLITYLVNLKNKQSEFAELFNFTLNYICIFDDGRLLKTDYVSEKFADILNNSNLLKYIN
jgi:integrase